MTRTQEISTQSANEARAPLPVRFHVKRDYKENSIDVKRDLHK